MSRKEAKAQANQQIYEAMLSWGLPAQKDGDSVICGLGPLRAKCVDVQISHGGRLASLIIELTVDPASNIVLRENIMQFSETTSQAVAGAAHLWTFSVFIAVAALLDAEGCPGHMAGRHEREFADADGTLLSWKIYSSPLMLLGNSQDSAENREGDELIDCHPETLPLIEPFFAELCGKQQLLAIKTFLINSGVELYGDCTINGVASEPLLEALKQFKWPPGQGMRMLRQYHILAPADWQIDMTVPTPPPAPEKRGLLGKLFGHG
jgi:hypothetical protein